MATNEFYVAIVLIHTARLLDKCLDRRVLIELSSGARFDRAFAGVGSRRAVLGWRLGRKIVGCDERDCREAEEDTSAHCSVGARVEASGGRTAPTDRRPSAHTTAPDNFGAPNATGNPPRAIARRVSTHVAIHEYTSLLVTRPRSNHNRSSATPNKHAAHLSPSCQPYHCGRHAGRARARPARAYRRCCAPASGSVRHRHRGAHHRPA